MIIQTLLCYWLDCNLPQVSYQCVLLLALSMWTGRYISTVCHLVVTLLMQYLSPTAINIE